MGIKFFIYHPQINLRNILFYKNKSTKSHLKIYCYLEHLNRLKYRGDKIKSSHSQKIFIYILFHVTLHICKSFTLNLFVISFFPVDVLIDIYFNKNQFRIFQLCTSISLVNISTVKWGSIWYIVSAYTYHAFSNPTLTVWTNVMSSISTQADQPSP